MSLRSVLIPLAFASVLSACSSPPDGSATATAPAVTVSTARVASEVWPSYVEAGGVLRAHLTAVVSSRMLAPVVAVQVRAGDRVARGQTLVVLDAAELRANAARLGAALQAAQLATGAAAAEERGAEAALVLARTTHARLATLLAERSATPQEVDEATARLAEAESRAAAAKAQAQAAASTLDAARAASQAATIAVGYATLTAPFAGIVADRRVDPGTMAVPGSALVVVEDPASLQLEVDLDASRAATVGVGQSVQVRLDDAADPPWVDGCIAEIARIDPAAHSFAIKIDLPLNPAWRSGQFGRARLAGPPRHSLSVPASAVVRRGQLSYVFALTSDGHAELRVVSTGDATADRAEVLSGVAAGETVIGNPPAGLADGAAVRTDGGRR